MSKSKLEHRKNENIERDTRAIHDHVGTLYPTDMKTCPSVKNSSQQRLVQRDTQVIYGPIEAPIWAIEPLYILTSLIIRAKVSSYARV